MTAAHREYGTQPRGASIAISSGRTIRHHFPASVIGSRSLTRFVDVTKDAGLFFEQHATTPSWGDYDNDGRPDLYVAGFLVNVTHYPDHLFHNTRQRDGGMRFEDGLPALVQRARRQPRRTVGRFRRRRRARPRAVEQRSGRRPLSVQEHAGAGSRAVLARHRRRRQPAAGTPKPARRSGCIRPAAAS